jgi:hypothetical protein
MSVAMMVSSEAREYLIFFKLFFSIVCFCELLCDYADFVDRKAQQLQLFKEKLTQMKSDLESKVCLASDFRRSIYFLGRREREIAENHREIRRTREIRTARERAIARIDERETRHETLFFFSERGRRGQQNAIATRRESSNAAIIAESTTTHEQYHHHE